jgi:hypothetical protein
MTLLISRSMSMSSNLMCVLLHVFMVTWHFLFHRVSHLRIRHRKGQDGGVKAEEHAQCQDRQLETLLLGLLYLVPAWLDAYPLGGDLDLAMAASSVPSRAPRWSHKRKTNVEQSSAILDSEVSMGRCAPPSCGDPLSVERLRPPYSAMIASPSSTITGALAGFGSLCRYVLSVVVEVVFGHDGRERLS